ncbi:acyl-CoA dehydrogenase FadE33 [Hyphomonas polymorpha PS728]|uniref:Acyl-CoA dehydrogenase FadE33 n=1 Tax=Hyphomonas polymorpha PS728 TaxID=1280954 RepID=A0A062V8Z3_9PROT|nr:acyl-CoA dehydrogenase [Hyphomonas polymorpha]KCZ96585.1 acyl-CoA dehydrogenase FadE33 [Hyphomonas polymorpha PS728]
MNLNHTEEQKLIIESLRGIVKKHGTLLPDERRALFVPADEMEIELRHSGFLDLAEQDGMGALEAVLVVEELSASARVIEVGASLLVAPQLSVSVPGPVALIRSSDIHKPHRFLPKANTALVLLESENDVAILDLASIKVHTVDTILGYPFGTFASVPDLDRAPRAGSASGDVMRKWWRLAIAAECSGAIRSATEFTTDYVKDRVVFGRPLGAFQALQHRLAHCHKLSNGLHWLLMRAAWSEAEVDAALVALYAQQHIQQIVFDLHQFNGAMGMTLEHALHFWTYRLRALQGELGGFNEQALAAAKILWSGDKSPCALPELMRGDC